MIISRQSAFTLAEVLITLVIIGVIAAITVPSLINRINNQETVSRLKKAHATLSQTTNLIITTEGPVSSWTTSANNIYNLYKKKMLNAKECNRQTGCYNQSSLLYLNGQTDPLESRTDLNKLVLADGAQVIFSTNGFSSTCTMNDKWSSGSNDVCLYIYVDTNGAKKPNTMGRDTFLFVLKKTGLYPGGCDIERCVGTQGYGCTCKVLKEGAINY